MFNNLAFRFSTGILVIISAVFGAYGALDYRIASSELHRELDERVELVNNNLSSSLPNALWNFETETIENALKNAINTDEIDIIAVSDDNGTFFGYTSNKVEIEVLNSLEGYVELIDYPITLIEGEKERHVGTLHIRKNVALVQAQLSQLIIFSLVKTVVAAGILVVAIVILMRSLVSKPILSVSSALKDIAHGEGDLTKRLPEDGVQELQELAIYFNKFVKRIHSTIEKVYCDTVELSSAMTSLKSVVNASSESMAKQKDETDQVVTSINKMSDSSSVVASNAKHAAESAMEAHEQASKAMQFVNTTVEAVENMDREFGAGRDSIDSVQGDVDEISSVLDVIRGIAEKTNLLALNAAIEAARAGEQGRGFAVVADEVRGLASRTQESTGEIQSMMERLQSSAGDAVTIIQRGSESSKNALNMANDVVGNLSAIVRHVGAVTDMNKKIAASIDDQDKLCLLYTSPSPRDS